MENKPIILVASPETAAKIAKKYDWKELLEEAAAAILFPDITGLLLNAVRKACKNDELKINLPFPVFSLEEARKLFNFDLGHPVDGVIYLQNPVNTKQYLLPATSGERFLQEKMGAFIQIVGQLGAKKLTLLSGEVETKSASSEAEIKEVAQKIGITVAFDAERNIQRQSYAEFDEPTEQPYISDDLRIWCEHDPFLKTLVNSRLNGKIKKLKTILKLTNSTQTQAKVLYDMGISGVNLGGKYVEVSSSTWEFEVEFY